MGRGAKGFSILVAMVLTVVGLSSEGHALGLNADVGLGYVGGGGGMAKQVEIIPYYGIAIVHLELGYRADLGGQINHSVVPAARVAIPGVLRVRAGLPIGLAKGNALSIFAGVQRDIIALPLVSLYWELDAEKPLKGDGFSVIARVGGSLGL